MLSLTIVLNTQSASPEDIHMLISDGKLTYAKGSVNGRWEEFSAVDLARCSDLQGVDWEMTYDDTPGALLLLIDYFHQSKEQIETRIRRIHAAEEYQIYE